MRIHRTERIVEEIEVCLAVDGPGHTDTLALATREVDATLANLGLVPGWQDGKVRAKRAHVKHAAIESLVVWLRRE